MALVQLTYLVLVHDKPDQLRALLELLVADGDRALVHVDATTDAGPFMRIADDVGPDVRFAKKRHDVRWGGFGAVAATLTLLSEAVDLCPADHYVLLSGTDLPIRPTPDLHRHLSTGAVHMNCWPMPDEARGKPMSRLENYHFASSRRGSPIAYRFNQLLRRLPRRNVEKGLQGAKPFAGGQWWSMPHDCAVATLDFVVRAPAFVRFFHHVAVPDEIFFQTVLMALPKSWLVRPSLTYTRWSGGVSPDLLRSRDVEALAGVDAFFARKFDLDQDPGVVALIRETLLSPPRS